MVIIHSFLYVYQRVLDDTPTEQRLHPLNPFGPKFLSPTSPTAGVKLLPDDQRLRVAKQGLWAKNGQHSSTCWILVLRNGHQNSSKPSISCWRPISWRLHGDTYTSSIFEHWLESQRWSQALVTRHLRLQDGRTEKILKRRWPCHSPSLPKHLLRFLKFGSWNLQLKNMDSCGMIETLASFYGG